MLTTTVWLHNCNHKFACSQKLDGRLLEIFFLSKLFRTLPLPAWVFFNFSVSLHFSVFSVFQPTALDKRCYGGGAGAGAGGVGWVSVLDRPSISITFAATVAVAIDVLLSVYVCVCAPSSLNLCKVRVKPSMSNRKRERERGQAILVDWAALSANNERAAFPATFPCLCVINCSCISSCNCICKCIYIIVCVCVSVLPVKCCLQRTHRHLQALCPALYEMAKVAADLKSSAPSRMRMEELQLRGWRCHLQATVNGNSVQILINWSSKI